MQTTTHGSDEQPKLYASFRESFPLKILGRGCFTDDKSYF